MSNPDDVIAAHNVQLTSVLAGHFWMCTCGESGAPSQSESEARRQGERHVADQLGLQPPSRASDEEALAMLVAIKRHGRRVDPADLSELGQFPDIIAGLEDLEKRGWVYIGKPNRGDDRLLSARDVTLSPLGEQTIRKAILEAIDLVVAGEPDAPEREPLRTSIPDVAGKRRARAEFMDKLYDETDGSTAKVVDPRSIGLSLGWAPQLTADIVRYLDQEGLVSRPAWGAVSIAHTGVREVEQLREEPQSKTEHFNPINYIHVGDNNSGAIQVGTSNSTQTQFTASVDVGGVTTFLRELREALLTAEMADETRNMALAQVEVVQGVIATEGADSPVVRRLLPSLKEVGLSLVASGAYDALREAIHGLLS